MLVDGGAFVNLMPYTILFVNLVRNQEISVSIAIANPVYWELEDFECFFGKLWEGGFIKINDEGQQLIQAIGSESLF